MQCLPAFTASFSNYNPQPHQSESFQEQQKINKYQNNSKYMAQKIILQNASPQKSLPCDDGPLQVQLRHGWGNFFILNDDMGIRLGTPLSLLFAKEPHGTRKNLINSFYIYVFMYLFIHFFVYTMYLFVHSFLHCLTISLSIYFIFSLLIHRFIKLCIYSFIYLPIHLFNCSFIYFCIHWFIYLFMYLLYLLIYLVLY